MVKLKNDKLKVKCCECLRVIEISLKYYNPRRINVV